MNKNFRKRFNSIEKQIIKIKNKKELFENFTFTNEFQFLNTLYSTVICSYSEFFKTFYNPVYY